MRVAAALGRGRTVLRPARDGWRGEDDWPRLAAPDGGGVRGVERARIVSSSHGVHLIEEEEERT